MKNHIIFSVLTFFLTYFILMEKIIIADEIQTIHKSDNGLETEVNNEISNWLREVEILRAKGDNSINLIYKVENDPHIGSLPTATLLLLEVKNHKDLLSNPLKLFVKLLDDENVIVASGAAIALGYHKNKDAIIPLTNKFHSTNSEYLQNSIVIALGIVGDNSSLSILHKIISDCNNSNIDKSLVFESLGLINDETSIGYITQYLNSCKDEKEAIYRSAAVRALGCFKNDDVNNKLINILNDLNESCFCRHEAAEILSKELNTNSHSAMKLLINNKDNCLMNKLLLILQKTE